MRKMLMHLWCRLAGHPIRRVHPQQDRVWCPRCQTVIRFDIERGQS
jgi:hypothetical protein